jgi:hypothetical protein
MKEDQAKGETEVTAGEVQQKVAEAADASVEYAAQKKQEYEEAIAAQLVQLDGQLAELREKAEAAKEKVQTEATQALHQLEDKRDAIQQKLEEIRAKGPDAWEDLKEGLDQALTSLKEACEEARTRFD